MISCTEFIMAYSELFTFLEERHGKQAVVNLWESLADGFLQDLRDLVAEKGLAGMHEYWTRTLSEEGAKYTITLMDEYFCIEMDRCPSVAILRRNPHIQPYPDYCEHCFVLYNRVIAPFRFKCELCVCDPVKGRCRLRVTPRRRHTGEG